MSKRFGRNQRRRAREDLAAELQRSQKLAKIADQWKDMHDFRNRELSSLTRFFEMVARRVGRESILVGGEAEAEIHSPDVREFRAHVNPELEFVGIGASPVTTEGVKLEIMRRLEVKAVRDVFRRQIVVRCFLGNVDFGIAVSQTLLERSTEEEIAHTLSKELACRLAHEIKKAMR